MKLRITDLASADLQHIHGYISLDRPEAAGRVIRRIRASARRLRDHPLIGRAGERAGTRERVVRGLPYLLVYELNEASQTLIVLRVFQGAQDRGQES